MFERLNCIEQIEGVARSIAFDRISVTPAQFRSRALEWWKKHQNVGLAVSDYVILFQ